MITIAIRDEQNQRFYRARVTPAWARRHDNGALFSCGLTVEESLTRRSFTQLLRSGALIEITREQWNHSGCQSYCTLRGDKECRW